MNRFDMVVAQHGVEATSSARLSIGNCEVCSAPWGLRYATATRRRLRAILSSAGLSRATMRPSTTKATRSQSSSAVAMSWVVRKMVRPRAFRSRIMFLTVRALTGSNPDVGSSRNSSSGGSLINDRANVRRICIPLEYLATRVSATSVSPTASRRCLGSRVSPP